MDFLRGIYDAIASAPQECFITAIVLVLFVILYDTWQKARRIK